MAAQESSLSSLKQLVEGGRGGRGGGREVMEREFGQGVVDIKADRLVDR